MRFCEKDNLSLVQAMIRTNMYFLCNLSKDDVGGDWDWIEEAKNNLIKMEFKTEKI
jgi:hypothetical protein